MLSAPRFSGLSVILVLMFCPTLDIKHAAKCTVASSLAANSVYQICQAYIFIFTSKPFYLSSLQVPEVFVNKLEMH